KALHLTGPASRFFRDTTSLQAARQVNAGVRRGRKSMLDRIADGRTDLVFDYLAQGHPANSTDGQGGSLLSWCAYYGDVSAIRYLVAQGAALASLGENLDLITASFHGHWQLCQFLIENGADVNHPDPDTGETALHAALCTTNRLAHDLVVKVLLAAGGHPTCGTQPSKEEGSVMRGC